MSTKTWANTETTYTVAHYFVARHGLTMRRLVLGLIVVMVVAVDQTTKTLAENHPSAAVMPHHVFGPVYFVLTLNPGASFGMAHGHTLTMATVVILLTFGLILFAVHAIRTVTLPVVIGLGLFVGGALSNVSGRVLRDQHGAVIDFIDVARLGNHDYWPVFNLADIALLVGGLLLLLACVVPHRHLTGEPLGWVPAAELSELPELSEPALR